MSISRRAPRRELLEVRFEQDAVDRLHQLTLHAVPPQLAAQLAAREIEPPRRMHPARGNGASRRRSRRPMMERESPRRGEARRGTRLAARPKGERSPPGRASLLPRNGRPRPECGPRRAPRARSPTMRRGSVEARAAACTAAGSSESSSARTERTSIRNRAEPEAPVRGLDAAPHRDRPRAKRADDGGEPPERTNLVLVRRLDGDLRALLEADLRSGRPRSARPARSRPAPLRERREEGEGSPPPPDARVEKRIQGALVRFPRSRGRPRRCAVS